MHCSAYGLIGIPTSVMSRYSVFLGGRHIDYLFFYRLKKGKSPYQIAEQAIARIFVVLRKKTCSK